MRLIYFIIGLILLCAPIHALDYTYNATTGIYNLNPSASSHVVPVTVYSAILESKHCQYDATNESYITLLPLGDILEDQYSFYVERCHNASYQGKYNESSYLNESEVNNVTERCDEVVKIGKNLLKETIIRFEQKDYIGTLECYKKFSKIQAVTPTILQIGVKAAHVLAYIKHDLGTYDVNTDRTKEQDYENHVDDFKYDDTKARKNAESAASILADQEKELDDQEKEKEYQASFNASGIKITAGQYESSLVTVPMNNTYETSFQIRTVGKMLVFNGGTMSQALGSGKDYHTENFTQTRFFMSDNLDISIAKYKLFISIAHYTGPAKYQPTSPFNPLRVVTKTKTDYILNDGSNFKIDGHTGTECVSSDRSDMPKTYAVSYALDSNTFVEVSTVSMDYDKDVSLLLQTLHIEKKVK